MDENEVMKLMDAIDYGWLDKNGIKHTDDFNLFKDKYILQSPEEVIKNKIGVCWDQVELERHYFKGNSIKTFFIVHYDNKKSPTHTFLVLKKQNNYYWFEHSWKRFRGIHKYHTLKELIEDIKNKFIHYELKDKYIKENLIIYEYTKPKYNISVQEFYKHCEGGDIYEG